CFVVGTGDGRGKSSMILEMSSKIFSSASVNSFPSELDELAASPPHAEIKIGVDKMAANKNLVGNFTIIYLLLELPFNFNIFLNVVEILVQINLRYVWFGRQ
ncbi:MAG: hypothetical protein ACO2ZZ_13515, partial [Cyclobacteriaceae bacterium]